MVRTDRPYWPHSQPDPQTPPRPRRPASRACLGPCNTRWRRAQQTLDAHDAAVKAWEDNPAGSQPDEPQVPVVSPWPGDPVFCPRCQAKLRLRLAELDDLASIAAREADGHRSGPDAERVSGTRGTRSPSPAADTLDELASMLRGWESAARRTDSTPPRRGYLATEITTTVCWLVAHFETLITNPDTAADFAREITEWHRMLTRMTKAGTARHPKPMPCPRCDARSLEWEEGTEYVECTNRDWGNRECRKLMSLAEYDAAFDAWMRNGQHHEAA